MQNKLTAPASVISITHSNALLVARSAIEITHIQRKLLAVIRNNVSRTTVETSGPQTNQFLELGNAACLSGSISVAGELNRPDEIKFDNCNIKLTNTALAGHYLANGGFEIISTNAFYDSKFDGTIVFDQFQFGAITYFGAVEKIRSASSGIETGYIYSDRWPLSVAGSVEVLVDYRFDYSSNSLNGVDEHHYQFTLQSNLLDGSIDVQVMEPLRYQAEPYIYPFAGEILYKGANNSQLKLRVSPGYVGDAYDPIVLELDSDGDNNFDTIETNINWCSLVSC